MRSSPSQARPRRASRRAALLALASLPLAGCPRPDPSDGKAEAAPSAEDPADARAEAHRHTFDAALAQAAAAFAIDAPLAHAILGEGPLDPGGPTLDRLEDLRRAVAAARRESSELDEGQLSTLDRVSLRTLRFGLDRAEDRLAGFAPHRSDPAHALGRLHALLDEFDRRRATAQTDAAPPTRAAWAASIAALERELVTASGAGAALALARLERLEHRLSAIAPPPDEAGEAQAGPDLERSISGLRARLNALHEAARSAPTDAETDEAPAWTRPTLVGTDPGPLPPRLGYAALERRLRVEEGIAADLRALLSGIEANLARLDAMKRPSPAPTAAPAPVDAARCEAAFEELAAAVEALGRKIDGEDALVLTRPRCEELARQLEGQALDPAQLELALLDRHVILPSRRAIRRAQHPAVGLVGGELAPWAQLDSRRIVLTAQFGHDATSARAIAEARARLCLAGVALLYHASDLPPSPEGVGEDPRGWAAPRCPELDLDLALREAEADPRGALRGLGFAFFDDRPDIMAGIDRFYWAPMGLTYLLAHPESLEADPSPAPEGAATPRVIFEQLDAETGP